MDEDTYVDVLVVDDEAEIADVIAEMLRIEGYTVEVAYDGVSALERARRRPPALLISDVRMPRISGYELAVRIHQGIADICAIFISALSQALPPPPFGVLLAKPFNFDTLLDLVQQMLHRRPNGGGGHADFAAQRPESGRIAQASV